MNNYDFDPAEIILYFWPWLYQKNTEPLEEALRSTEPISPALRQFAVDVLGGKLTRPHGKRKTDYKRDIRIYDEFEELTTRVNRQQALSDTELFKKLVALESKDRKLPTKTIEENLIKDFIDINFQLGWLTYSQAETYLSKKYNISEEAVKTIVKNEKKH